MEWQIENNYFGEWICIAYDGNTGEELARIMEE